MRFENYNEFQDKKYSILDEKGQIVLQKDLPSFTDDELLYLYKTMLYSRIIDEKALSYQRQGRMLTYAPNIGQEATQIGSAYAMEKEDWLVPSFRELGALLIRGVPLEKIYLYWYGNEEGSKLDTEKKVLPVSVPIASQLQHATGIGIANNIKKENNVVVTYVGDGGTSHGDFHEALNFAAVFNAPVVFIVQNNQYAISVPRHNQTVSKTIAQKSMAYGMPGILVDGNDIFAMYSATKEAIDRARKGEGPSLIEAYTYRLGAHTTSDDPTIYRDDEEVQKWKEKDPIKRFKKYLMSKNLISDHWEEETKRKLNEKVGGIFEEIEAMSHSSVEDIFKYHYETMPPQLEEQLMDYKEFLEGGRK